MAHSNKLGGHFSYKETVATLARLFTWPNISKDNKAWCRSCPECQKAAKKTSYLAPLCPLPVISTPFSRMAFDLVGPLPKSKSGNIYILTYMCLASKYPEAVALRGVDAEMFAEAMMEIFSRAGLPEEILTDQDSVFMGSLTKQLCQLLDVKWLRTSPYRPQTDGCLECWHGSLKNMLRKWNECKKEWDNILKYFLFAYTSAPLANTGFSPFEVVLGRPVRGQLDVVKEGWLSGEMDQKTVVEWVDQLGEKLIEMREVVVEREKAAKASMKAQYDKKAQSCELEVGMLVLVRTPNLSGKLDRLRKAGLTAKSAKCQWGSAPLTFLGHTVGRGKMSTPDHRVKAIRNHMRSLRGEYTIFSENLIFFPPCHNFFPLSSVQIIIIPACCLLCVL